MRSSWSLGVVYIALGGLSVSGIGGHRPLGAVPWVLAGLLVAAGAFLFTRTRISFYVALAVGALTAITGILALAHHPELALPVPPALSIGVGLYLVFRTAIASPTFGAKKKGFVP
ncbi:MAG TPA: hypothetical protein VF334_23005 [Polyangia bacterium]